MSSLSTGCKWSLVSLLESGHTRVWGKVETCGEGRRVQCKAVWGEVSASMLSPMQVVLEEASLTGVNCEGHSSG